MMNLFSYRVIYFRPNSSRKVKMSAMKTLFDHLIVPINAIYKIVIILSYCINKMTIHVSSSYSLSSVMFSYILAQMPRDAPQPVEQSKPALLQEEHRVSHRILKRTTFSAQRVWSNIHVTLHGQQFTFYCFPAKILWMQLWTKP